MRQTKKHADPKNIFSSSVIIIFKKIENSYIQLYLYKYLKLYTSWFSNSPQGENYKNIYETLQQNSTNEDYLIKYSQSKYEFIIKWISKLFIVI